MRILAVIVTYNRLELLKQCIGCLERQTVPCDILVIDNASADGTEAFGREKAGEHFFYERMPENLGGAGGFHAGIKWGALHGYDRLWIMDDDCLPEAEALSGLVKADEKLNGNYGWLSSKCLWTDGELCPMNLQRRTPYRDIEGFHEELVPAQMASFVSLFLKTETVRELGLPIAEFVIWTDDWEYTRRISRKLPCYAVSGSVVTHAMKNKTVVNIATDSPDRLARYKYFYRNDVVLYREEGIKGWLWLVFKDCWHSAKSLLKGHPGRIRVIVSGFFAGVKFHPEIPKAED